MNRTLGEIVSTNNLHILLITWYFQLLIKLKITVMNHDVIVKIFSIVKS